jgi:hypothetical protein
MALATSQVAQAVGQGSPRAHPARGEGLTKAERPKGDDCFVRAGNLKKAQVGEGLARARNLMEADPHSWEDEQWVMARAGREGVVR